jgi:hypothetical protein
VFLLVGNEGFLLCERKEIIASGGIANVHLDVDIFGFSSSPSFGSWTF